MADHVYVAGLEVWDSGALAWGETHHKALGGRGLYLMSVSVTRVTYRLGHRPLFYFSECLYTSDQYAHPSIDHLPLPIVISHYISRPRPAAIVRVAAPHRVPLPIAISHHISCPGWCHYNQYITVWAHIVWR